MQLRCRGMLALVAMLVAVHACDCGWGQETRPDAGPDAGPPDAGPPDAGRPDAGGCVSLGQSCSNTMGPWCCDDLSCWQSGAGLVCQNCFGLSHACTNQSECCPGTSCVHVQTFTTCQSDAGCECVLLLP